MKRFLLYGVHGSSDTVSAKSAAAARKMAENVLGEAVLKVELVPEDIPVDDTDDADVDEPTEEE